MFEKFDLDKSEKTLESFSIDASIFRIRPSGVFAPKTKTELLEFVREAILAKNANPDSNVSVSSRAAGTCMSGGSLTDQYIISFTEHLNKIIKIDKDNKTITLEPGVFYRDMEKETVKKGLILPSYPASRELCAIGGMVGNNAAGEKTFKYGKTLNYVKEIEMICVDGNIYRFKEFVGDELQNILDNDKTLFGDLHRAVYRLIQHNEDEIKANTPAVTKNSSGYYLWDVYQKDRHAMNLAKLICGSQGTLGVMTEIALGLVDYEKKSKMAVVFLRNVADMPKVVNMISPLAPESFEVFDDHTFKIAMKFLPQILKRLGGSIFSLAKLFWPEFKMVLTGNIPKIVMLIEFVEKDRVTLNKKEKDLKKVFSLLSSDEDIQTHIVSSEAEAKKYWVFRRESFNLLRSKLKDVRTVPFIEDVVVKSSDLPLFLPRFEKILDDNNLVYTIAGHVGDGNIHVIPLMKLREDKSIEEIKTISDQVYELVREYHGSLSGEHNDGLIRAPFLNYMFSDKMINIFKEVKNIFDSKGVFNPNKKVGINWEYSKSKIDRRK